MAAPSYGNETMLQAPDGQVYEPTAKEQQKVALVEERFAQGSRDRTPHERTWFITAAFARGNQRVQFSDATRSIVEAPQVRQRERRTINLMQANMRARFAKFVRNRPVPVVVPATSEIGDRLKARATTKAIAYVFRKAQLDRRYREAVLTAQQTNHGYWWYSWDPTKLARVLVDDPLSGQKQLVDAQLGDVSVENGTPYEVVVADPALSFVGDQPWIIRSKLRSIDYVRGRFTEKGKYVAADTTIDPATGGLSYQRQIAGLSGSGINAGTGLEERHRGNRGEPTHVLVKEYFEAPCPSYPKGRYCVVANGVLLKEQEELPYGFWDLPNPYPCTDFSDYPQTGQYWGTTIAEQIVGPQREYNTLRSYVADQLKKVKHPKLLVAVQHQMPQGAYTDAAGEVVPYVARPGIPPPQILQPGNIAPDVWKLIELLRGEIEAISHIFREAEGQVGQATSGFQTNLLQEAVDQVHKPDLQAHEDCIVEAAHKIRRILKQGYDVPRLITIAGRDLEPEVLEFSGADIDDQADIVIQADSMLPQFKGAKIQAILELWKAELLGDPADPETRRRAQVMLEMGSIDDTYDFARRDEERARLENNAFIKGQLVEPPLFCDHHEIHYRFHTDQLKSPETPNEVKKALLAHIILHVKFQNPQSAIQLATQYGMPELVVDLFQPPAAGAAPSMGSNVPTPGTPTAPAGAPTPAAMDGAQQFDDEFGFGAQGLNASGMPA